MWPSSCPPDSMCQSELIACSMIPLSICPPWSLCLPGRRLSAGRQLHLPGPGGSRWPSALTRHLQPPVRLADRPPGGPVPKEPELLPGQVPDPELPESPQAVAGLAAHQEEVPHGILSELLIFIAIKGGYRHSHRSDGLEMDLMDLRSTPLGLYLWNLDIGHDGGLASCRVQRMKGRHCTLVFGRTQQISLSSDRGSSTLSPSYTHTHTHTITSQFFSKVKHLVSSKISLRVNKYLFFEFCFPDSLKSILFHWSAYQPIKVPLDQDERSQATRMFS